VADVAEGESPGLAAVKAEGAAIVAAREGEWARARESEETLKSESLSTGPEAPKKKRRRCRRRADEVAEVEATQSLPRSPANGAVSVSQRSLDPADDYPPVMSERPYRLTFEDGSECDVPSDGRVIGPN
jgi:hypothetical protein